MSAGPDGATDATPEPTTEPTGGTDIGRVRDLRRLGVALAYLTAWAAASLVIAGVIFLNSDRTVNIASHDAVINPSLTGNVVVDTGPVLPDLRLDSGSRLGIDIELGKTEAPSTDALVARYGVLASEPAGTITKVRGEIVGMFLDALVTGGALGVVPPLVWAAVGRRRRRDLLRRIPSRQGALVGGLVVVVALGLWQPWHGDPETVGESREWQSLAQFIGPEVPIPAELAGVEVRGDVTTNQTRRLVESAIDTFDKSKSFYDSAALAAADLELREPAEGETVVALVSDRHDNIGMDRVARAVADRAGATGVFDAGDDTSTGSSWEAFSLDSLDAAFGDLDHRWSVTGNHDNGEFVGSYLADRGWTVLQGESVEGPAGTRLLGVGDPRSSGLGSWRDETGLSFDAVRQRLADEACAENDDGERPTTVMVHDANLADEVLRRGCADLVIGGHLHVQEGPTQVVGENGDLGWTYTTGTTGGAAYAFALGSKIRRPAEITIITYADGAPLGLQPVVLQSNGRFDVGDFVELDYDDVVDGAIDESGDAAGPTQPLAPLEPSTTD